MQAAERAAWLRLVTTPGWARAPHAGSLHIRPASGDLGRRTSTAFATMPERSRGCGAPPSAEARSAIDATSIGW